MLLNSIIFLFIILNKNFIYQLTVSILLLTINFFNKKKTKIYQNIKHVYIFFILISISKIFIYQEGEVLIKLGKFFITKLGFSLFLNNFLRLINLTILAHNITILARDKISLGEYEKIFSIILDMTPKVFNNFKKRRKIKYFYKNIFKEIYKRL
ncbi:hypothetical protein EV215_0493 [Hypnocyclicus thermotrophus]|uniref:Uncharacterized protein n=1 Tax=Hypnocyclicus thermotrophus TaxID=1627895 RepID=A0AA46DZI1_9FUSO|nr:hypothetical protein [Hypnocyclicus thermotrophus]TDT71809.1 hypothetical protein EV215_0493 [Hypnocyclicus thermotrophus]